MITVTTTQLHAQFFEFLDKVADGETIVIGHKGKKIARLEPLEAID